MNWLFPTFLAGIAAIALPLALHFLRRQPRRTIVFPSLRFLAAAHQRTEKKHRLMRLIVLTLRCLALALLAGAFARPFFGANDLRSGRSIVVVVDNSFSLQAKDRWPAIQAWARQQIGPLRPGDKLGLMQTGPLPAWLAPLTADTGAVLKQLDQLTPGWQSARVEPALHLAADTLVASGGGERRLVLLTDHQRLAWAGSDFSKALAPGVLAQFPSVAAPVVRQAALQPPVLSRSETGLHVSISVRNFTGTHARKLQAFRDAELVALHEESFTLGDRETRTVQFDLPASTPGATARLRFSLDADDLPADDTVYAVWQAGADRTLLLDAAPPVGGADFIAAALESTAAMKPALAVSPIPAGAWPVRAVAVLRNDASFSGAAAARLETFLREGGSALVFVHGGGAQKKWLADNRHIAIRPLAPKEKSLVVRDWAMDHPIVAAMAEHEVSPLLGWNFRQGWALPPDAVESLALWSDEGVAIGEVRAGAGHLLLCGFSPDRRESDWPVHAAFVPFLHRAVSYLLGVEATATAQPIKVGDAVTLPAESGTWRALDGPAVSEPTRVVTSPVKPALPGVYEFGEGTTRKLFAVNVAPEESDPATWTEGTPWLGLSSTQPAAASRDQPRVNLAALDAEQRSPLWWWLLAGVAFLLLAELGLANRTAR